MSCSLWLLLSLRSPNVVQCYIHPDFMFSGLAFIHPAGSLLKKLNSLGLIHKGSVASM